MIPLVCIDVDGTLVGATGEVAEPVWEAVDAALARGHHLALSTARGAFGASWHMAKRLDPDGWHVFHAGGAVVHAGTSMVEDHAVSSADIDASARIAAERNWVIEYYSAADYTVASDSKAAIDHAALLGVPFAARSLVDLDGAVVRVQFVVDEEEISDVAHAVRDLDVTVTSATSPIMPGTAFVSATRRGVTKATGIATIAGQLGLRMTDVMMIGDGLNDLPALEAVGHPVAMGNAAPEVHEVAAHHVADVERHGVVEALEIARIG
ncbi:MAG: Cof-type HAD-IIB family hydrolase [Acidimicrobiales bacterium]